MIKEHQPTIFPARIIVRVSSVEDGNIKNMEGADRAQVRQNRQTFLDQSGITIDRTNLVRISYDRDDYCRYSVADEHEMGVSMTPEHETTVYDALATGQPGQGLFLPIADCCAVALADINQMKIMLSHVGRHSAEQDGARKSVEFMQREFGSAPGDIVAWLSPAAGKENFPIYNLDNKGLQEVVLAQLKAAGIPEQNIEISPVDTTVDERYFSHSQFLKGNRYEDGRFAVAMVIEP